jgi:uncharacterized protein (DUF433 family)
MLEDLISIDPKIMGGAPCIKGTRVTVGTIHRLIISGIKTADILEWYPYLKPEDISAVLIYKLQNPDEINYEV